MGAFLLTEARGIAGQRLRQFFFRDDGIDELSDHRMFAGSDQIQIFPFDLIHHGVHFGKAHNTRYYVTSNHERRNTVGESSVNHEISRIRDHRRMQSGDISHQIVESVSCNFSCTFQIDPIESFHDLRMIRNLKIRNNGLSISGNFHVFAVIFADRDRRVNDIGNGHHVLQNLFLKFCLFRLKFFQSLGSGSHFRLLRFCLFFLSLLHQASNFFGNSVSARAQFIRFLLRLSALLIQLDHFVHQGKLLILKLLSDIFLYRFWILPQKLNVNHAFISSLFLYFFSYLSFLSCFI